MQKSYLRLGVSLLISLVVMFTLTMSMVRTVDHFHLSLSNLYMAVVMVAPMGLIMLFAMWKMFPNKAVNIALVLGFAALWAGAWTMGRQEAFVGDEQFLKSMIPHHSRAILVCQEADLTDPEIIRLCDGIVKSQQDEIAQMDRILQRYQ